MAARICMMHMLCEEDTGLITDLSYTSDAVVMYRRDSSLLSQERTLGVLGLLEALCKFAAAETSWTLEQKQVKELLLDQLFNGELGITSTGSMGWTDVGAGRRVAKHNCQLGRKMAHWRKQLALRF